MPQHSQTCSAYSQTRFRTSVRTFRCDAISRRPPSPKTTHHRHTPRPTHTPPTYVKRNRSASQHNNNHESSPTHQGDERGLGGVELSLPLHQFQGLSRWSLLFGFSSPALTARTVRVTHPPPIEVTCPAAASLLVSGESREFFALVCMVGVFLSVLSFVFVSALAFPYVCILCVSVTQGRLLSRLRAHRECLPV